MRQKQQLHSKICRLHRLTKTLAGKFKSTNQHVKDQQGNMIYKEEKVLKLRKEHFKKVFNMDEPESEANLIPAERVLDINTGPPIIDEVKKAISALKNGKAAGVYQITEMLQAEEYHTPNILTNILSKVWDTEEISSLRTTGLIVKLPMKGDLSKCNNWRGMMHLSVTSKVPSRVILNRI